MINPRFTRFAARCGFCCFVGLAVHAPAQERITDPDWTRHFRAGLLVGLNLKAEFRMSGQFGVSGSEPGLPGAGGTDHEYDDGYVRVDDFNNTDGLTTYWGYSEASQYDSVAHTLTFHSASSFVTEGKLTADEPVYLGFDMVYGMNLGHWRRARIGVDVGFGYLPLDLKESGPLPGLVTRTVHQYDTTGIVVPTAPYNGGSSGFAQPTLPDTATELPAQRTTGQITTSQQLEATFYTVRLGPTLHWELHRRLALSVSGGFGVGILSGDYKFEDTIVLSDGSSARNSGKLSGTDVTYGGYVSASLLVHIEPNADVYLAAQYSPMGDTTIGGQGRQARLNSGEGVYFAAGINWPF